MRRVGIYYGIKYVENNGGDNYKRTFKSGLSSAVIKCNYF